MIATAEPPAGLHDTGTAFGLDAVVTAVVWLGERPAFALGDGSVARADPDGRGFVLRRPTVLHDGAILCAACHPDGRSLLTGGDDGRLVRLLPDGRSDCLFATGGTWLHDLVASSVSSTIVAAMGKHAVVLRADGRVGAHRFAHPSSVGGLALDGKGRRLAVAHYGGVSLWWALIADGRPQQLMWKGSHLNLTWSPDGRHVVSAMQENDLHGWRVVDGDHMRMTGYHAKSRSLSWSAKGRWLLTSGADIVVGWPFAGKDGPKGKSPMELGPSGTPVTRVAAHPQQPIAAAGYADGTVRLLRYDGADIVIRAGRDDAVTALAWSDRGGALAWGTDDGHAGVFHPTAD